VRQEAKGCDLFWIIRKTETGEKVEGRIFSVRKSFSIDTFENFSVALDDWIELRNLSAATKTPFYIFVLFSDVAAFVKIDDSTVFEPIFRHNKYYVYIPISQFERIGA